MQFDVILEKDNLLLYINGLLTTLKLLGISLSIGLILSIPLAVLRVSSNKLVSGPVWLFTYVIRGTPMLVQVYLIYYALAQLEWIQERWNDVWPWVYFKEAVFCACLAFIINTTAYTVEMLAGAIRETSSGELEAARAMGMGKWMTMRRIVLPSALRRSLPAYSNEVIMMMQGTSLASVVPNVFDITGAASSVYSKYYLPFEAYITAGAIYLCLTFSLVYLFKLAERRFLAFLQPRKH